MDALSVGVDMAKASFVAGVWQGGQVRRVGQLANEVAGFAQLAAQVQAYRQAGQPVLLVVEPTGGYEWGLVAYAYEQGWQVALPNPKQVRDWAKGQGQRAKTDKVDAALLTEYGAKQQPHPQDPLPGRIQELAELLERRHDLEQMQRSEANRLGQYQARPQPTPAVVASLQSTLQLLAEQLAAIEQAIQELVNGDPDLKRRVQDLRSVPGIGAKNSLAVLVILYRWQARTQGQGDRQGLVAFVGLDPRPYQSGTSVHRRATISKMGDRTVRQALYMGALGGLNGKGHNPLRDFYRRLVGRGKAKRLALVAAARKILVWAWMVFSTHQPFDRSRYPQVADAT